MVPDGCCTTCRAVGSVSLGCRERVTFPPEVLVTTGVVVRVTRRTVDARLLPLVYVTRRSLPVFVSPDDEEEVRVTLDVVVRVERTLPALSVSTFPVPLERETLPMVEGAFRS